MSEARGCRLNRFSVLSEPLLRRIYDEYSPDELTHVGIVPQMRGGLIPKADAGAFRAAAARRPDVLELERRKLHVMSETSRLLDEAAGTPVSGAMTALPGTIACVSGFLLNMVRRSVKLISPCRATGEWPLGYIVFDEGTFTDAENLGRRLDEMIDRHMPLTISADARARLNPAFSYEPAAGGFNVATPTNTLTFHRPDMAGYLRSIGDQLHGGQKTASQIAFSAFYEHGVPEVHTLKTLELLFEKGLLDSCPGSNRPVQRLLAFQSPIPFPQPE